MPDEHRIVEWLLRIEAEYREMPGLELTDRQMQRLWGFDGGTCAAIVGTLVTRGVLRKTRTQTYVLARSF